VSHDQFWRLAAERTAESYQSALIKRRGGLDPAHAKELVLESFSGHYIALLRPRRLVPRATDSARVRQSADACAVAVAGLRARGGMLMRRWDYARAGADAVMRAFGGES
jgi:hypothetical protein